jgi:hypothetical protein
MSWRSEAGRGDLLARRTLRPTGMLGAVVTTSSIAVGSRCSHAAAGVGAVLTSTRPILAWARSGSTCCAGATRPQRGPGDGRRDRRAATGASSR